MSASMTMYLPAELCELIVFHVHDVSTSLAWEDNARHYAIRPEIRQSLTALRLVSRSFNDSASPISFRHIIAKTASHHASRPLEQLIELSNSQYASYVCQVDLGFGDMTSSNDVDSGSYIDDLTEVLSSCLPRFPNLKALEFHNPPSPLPLDQRKTYTKNVASTVRSIPLPNLEELEIHFPYTRDFWEFFSKPAQIPIDDVLLPLRHLGIYVCENSLPETPGPQPINPNVPDNSRFSRAVYDLVQRAPKVESLVIRGEEILDISNLGFRRALGLRALRLDGVSVTSDVLLGLVEQCRETLAFVDLSRVMLYSGELEDVRVRLCKLPRLLALHVG